MLHETMLNLALGVAGASGGEGGMGSAPAGPASGMQSDEANNWNIQPIGINFGSILQPFTDAPANGGSGFNIPSRLFMGGKPLAVSTPTKKPLPIIPITLGIVALGVGMFVFMR